MRKVYYIIFIILFSLTTSIFATPNEDLLDAAVKGDLPKLVSVLTAGADINYADTENRTALYFAYDKEKTEIISYLKKNGAKETNLTK